MTKSVTTRKPSVEASPSLSKMLARIGLDSAANFSYPATSNPIFLLHGFVNAVKLGQIQGPPWILEPLVKSFEQYLAAKGDLPLEHALGLKHRKGPHTAWTKLQQWEEDRQLEWFMRSKIRKGLSQAQAAREVSASIEKHNSRLGIRNRQGEGLQQHYSRRLKTKLSGRVPL